MVKSYPYNLNKTIFMKNSEIVVFKILNKRKIELLKTRFKVLTNEIKTI